MKATIRTELAPAPIGPYSQAVRAAGMVYLSGQIAIDPETGKLDDKSIEAETHRVMKNIGEVLKAAGLGYEAVLKTTIFLSDMALFAEVNRVYSVYFTEPFPARETVAVKGLPMGVNVEISVIALCSE